MNWYRVAQRLRAIRQQGLRTYLFTGPTPFDRTTGTGILLRLLGARIAAWIRAGRRDDLTGLAAALGPLLRLLLVALGAALLWWQIRLRPWLLWILVPLWAWLAVRAQDRAMEAAEEQPEDDEPAAPDAAVARDAAVALLLEVCGDRDAVHLSTVLQHLQEGGHWKNRRVTDLKTRLDRLGIPVEDKIKAGGKSPKRGVRREALLALSPSSVPDSSTAPSTAA
ncbi:hypothetical protein [Streptomyces sp. NRRL F-5135]|uniref:hypothetical protein n=1 Tax=Streptomyces sp. NRRL F-5135 TaxID=1463858 RepID=UPI00068EE3EE|nr:hypothetical protein [Streptomyces sp. NRRL F-5135]